MKKWTYLVAALLATSAGSLMTGCIDNDEPYGIEQIRVATANLLEAKKALLDAQAAASNSAVEIAKIQAEIDKAKIEIDKIAAEAEAKVKDAEAQAILLRAQAEAAKTQAEAEQLLAQAAIAQAEADRIKAEAESAAKKAQAELDALIARTEADMKQAELAYENALYLFEKMKADNAASADNKLYKAVELAFQDYLDALSQYNDANKTYLAKQSELAKSEVDLVWVPGEDGGHFESAKYDQKDVLDKAIANAQAQIAYSEAAIAFYTEAAAAFEGVKSGELYTLLEGYEQQLAANEETLEKLKIEREEIYLKNKPLFDSVENLTKEISATETKDIEIAPYTYEPDASNSIPGFEEKIEYVEPGTTYKYATALDYNSPFLQTVYLYNNAINSLNKATMDENDKAWTQARINEMTRQLASAETEYEAAKANWEFAKKLYNNGGNPDLSILPLNDELVAAIEAYNATSAPALAAQEAYKAAITAREEAYKALEEAQANYEGETGAWAVYQKAEQAYWDANDEAYEKYWDALNANQSAYDKTMDKVNLDYKKAQDAAENANQATWIAQQQLWLDPENKQYQEALAAAQKAEEAANKALEAAGEAKEKAADAAAKTQQNADSQAWINCQKEQQTAKEAKQKAWVTYCESGGGNPDADPAYAAVKKAEEDYQAALNAEEEAAEQYNDDMQAINDKFYGIVEARQNQVDELYDKYGYYDLYWNNWYAFQNKCVEYIYTPDHTNAVFPEATIEEISPVYQLDSEKVFVNIKNYLYTTSLSAFGYVAFNLYDYPYGSLLSGENAFLIDVTKATIDSYIKLEFGENYPTYLYYEQYNNYGAFGATLYLENRIAMANVYLNNSDVIASTVSTLTANLEALVASYDAVADEIKALEEQKTEATKQIDALFADIKSREDAITHENKHLDRVISQINEAILKIELGIEGAEGMTADGVIETLVEFCDMMIASETEWIATQKDILARAEYQLKQYEEGYTKLENPKKLEVEAAKAALDLAQTRLDFYKARLDAAQERYDAAQKNNK